MGEYERKTKQVDTQAAIARSTAINRSRLEKLRLRQDVISRVGEQSKSALTEKLKDQATSKAFITKLITQGLLLLLEDEVQVRCRAQDDALVAGCIADAVKEYAALVQKETGVTKTVKVTLDKANKLPPLSSCPPSCMGGVVLTCASSTISIDNTIDARLALLMEQAKPNIRKLLFGQ